MLRNTSRPRARLALLATLNATALGALTAPAVAGLPRAVASFVPEDQRTASLAAVVLAGSVAALVSHPVVGFLSDRTRGSIGRRRPWILAGAIGGVCGVVGLQTAQSIAEMTVWWVVIQVAYNAVLAATTAFLADVTTDGARARASGVFTAAAFVGALPPVILLAVFPGDIAGISLLMPGLAALAATASFWTPEAGRYAPAARPRAVANLRELHLTRSFWAVWFQRFAMQVAFTLTTSFTLFLITARMTHDDPVRATSLAAVSTFVGGAGIAIGAVVAGVVGSRTGRYRLLLVLASAGLAGGASLRAFVDAPPLLWTASAIGGVSIGAYLAVNLALGMRAAPREHTGFALGILNAAETLPAAVTPAFAALLLRMGPADPVSRAPDDYALLYGCAALIALISLVALPGMRRLTTTT